jgi:hypothetical protein
MNMSKSARKSRPAAPSVLVAPSSAGEATVDDGAAVVRQAKSGSKGFAAGGAIGLKKGGSCGPESEAADTTGPGSQKGNFGKAARKARGGSVANMRGRSPFSAASNTSAASTRHTH